MIDRERLAALLGRERDSFAERHPRSRAAYAAAGANLLGNVPMTWMNKAAGRFPVYLAEYELRYNHRDDHLLTILFERLYKPELIKGGLP